MVEALSPAPSSEQASTVAVRRVATLVNRRAGALNQPLTKTSHNGIEAAFAHRGIHAQIHLIDGEDLRASAAACMEQAKRGEIDAIVIGGGDGTIHTVVSVLADSAVPLGVLPLGTLNHFAKDLGIPFGVDAAAAVVAEGHVRAVDLAEVNGEIFINNSSIGIYPYLVIDRERRRAHRKLAKWLAMVPAFFRMLRHLPRRRLRISAKGFERPYRTPCLFVGNNKYSTDLFTFGRRRQLDTGRLWFYVVKPRSPLGFFWMVCRLCFRHLNQRRDLDTFELAAAEVAAKASRLPVALDGEVKILHTPLLYRSLPQALRVIAPVSQRG
jgi:diacylglycerol kinase family enzyme